MNGGTKISQLINFTCIYAKTWQVLLPKLDLTKTEESEEEVWPLKVALEETAAESFDLVWSIASRKKRRSLQMSRQVRPRKANPRPEDKEWFCWKKFSNVISTNKKKYLFLFASYVSSLNLKFICIIITTNLFVWAVAYISWQFCR